MPVKGRFFEYLGFFNPHTKERSFDAERIKHWIAKGAQCSDSAHNLLVKAGIVKGPKRAVKIRKKSEEKKPTEAVEEKPEKKETEKPAEEKKPENKKEEPVEKEKKSEAPKEERVEEKKKSKEDKVDSEEKKESK